MKNEHTTYSGDSTGGAATSDWLHKPGSAVPFYQASAPATRLSGVALIDGMAWYDTTNAVFNIRVGGTWTAVVGFVELRTSDPGSPANGRVWLRTDL
jgi:hypothetical protein